MNIARTGFDPDIAVVASRNNLAARRTPQTDLDEAGAPAVLPTDVPVAPLFVRLVNGALRVAYRLVRPAVMPFARRARSFLVTDVRRDLWLQGNHLDHQLTNAHHELGTLRQTIDRTNRDVAEVLVRSQQLADQLADQIAHASSTASMLLARVETLRELVQQTEAEAGRTEAELVRQRDVFEGLLGRIEVASGDAARRIVVPTRPGELLVMTRAGFVLCPSDDEPVVAYLAESGDLERGTRLLIERVLVPGGVFVDVGANLGLHTLAAAATVGPTGRVVAFEPYAPTADLLRRSIALNGYTDVCEVHEIALWDSAGSAPLLLGTTSGHHSLVAPISTDADEGEVTVNTRTLDDVLGSGARVDLLKIDVEGAELRVLAGSRGVIESNPTIALIAELGAVHLEHSHTTLQEWLRAFLDFGLEWRVIEPLSGDLEVAEWRDLEAGQSYNLFFARPNTLAALIGSA